ncbi:hypothetical protein Q9295_01720 [Xinfangfangia sp. CPCC 101601]|uniref:Uncharacterized protein n=1 Tax=Pseudogemmobacter lacusdianii TaxID=3069608 RepID=A0ABU0VTN0_9RHOB|nr:hypothetical protein [Xinfangfangia sp. CPCC 101601]MDQ2065076.1 hypothetical protein [Xinfangfangia sp. CPCC 101601]
MDISIEDGEAVSLYFDLRPQHFIDLEVAAKAAIEWSRAIRAASTAVDPAFEYRVGLIAAEPGSSKWLAKIERSRINQIAKDTKAGFESIPLIMRLAIGLAVAIPTTIVPSYDYYLGNDGFSETQKSELEEIFRKASESPEVQEHQRSMYREAQKDPNITGVGGGVPTSKDWRPDHIVPASQFAEAEGLFRIQEPESEDERTLRPTLDVVLVTPRLENAKRAWTFRQEGMPGTFTAVMADPEFLAALADNKIRERIRLNIPMKIKLEIKEIKVDGEWRVKRRGRSVIEVLSPSPDPDEGGDHTTTP